MKVIKPYYVIVNPCYEYMTLEQYFVAMQKHIEMVARTCYKSENVITSDSYERFVKMLVMNEHEAMLEHSMVTVKFIVDRGISHELVRHRNCSYAQESTRYCNYSKDKFGNELTFIQPLFYNGNVKQQTVWTSSMQVVEDNYMYMLENGLTPQDARSILPNSLKTEINVTSNFREWRHFFKVRTDKAAHPQMREIAIPLLNDFKELAPCVFGDIEVKE